MTSGRQLLGEAYLAGVSAPGHLDDPLLDQVKSRTPFSLTKEHVARPEVDASRLMRLCQVRVAQLAGEEHLKRPVKN